MKSCQALTVALLFLLSSSAGAEYTPLPFYDLVGASGLVAVGEITELRPKTYVFRIERVLVGKCESQEIEITRFQDWSCAQRWSPYEVGQRQIVFVDLKPLETDADQPANPPLYRVRSGGGEGEFPIVDDQVYLMAPIPWEERPKEKIGRRHAVKQPLETVASAIEGYANWFSLTVEQQNGRRRIVSVQRRAGPRSTDSSLKSRFPPRRPVGPRSVAEYARLSEVHRILVETTEKLASEIAEREEEERLGAK